MGPDFDGTALPPRPADPQPLVQCNVRLTVRQSDRLTTLAQRVGVSKSAFVRHALDQAFARAERELDSNL